MAILIFERGKETGKRASLTSFPVIVGRDPANDVVVNDTECSRFHFRVKKRGFTFILEDLGSKNGTYINGDRVVNSVIKSNDRIMIGSSELIFMTSVANIHFADEIIDFNMVVSDQLGLKGPIDLSDKDSLATFKPERLPIFSVATQKSPSSGEARKLFDIHSNVLLQDNLEGAAAILLKQVNQIVKGVTGSALFLWMEPKKQLVPVAAMNSNTAEKLVLSHRAFADVITRKQTVILSHQNPSVTQSGRARVLIPMIRGNDVIAVLHLESASSNNPFVHSVLEFIQTLLVRVASYFESLLLRGEVDSWLVGMMETIIATVEAKDTYTRGHSERVSRYSMAMAEELRLDRETKKLLMVSALCHDVGKIGIPDSILKKAGLLSADEYNEMKLHPTIGADIMSRMPNAQRFLSGVKYHHEKWDGTGYPEGLAGEDIPFFARIVGVADVYDAMISGRSYSGFLDQAEAAGQLSKETELFDSEILKAFERAFNSGALTLKTDTQNQGKDEESKDAS